jgi:hypothetical protein
MKYYIYTLTDPRDGIVKYIGQTKNPKDRLQHHLSPSNLTETWKPKEKWLKNLKNEELKPIMEILDIGDENNIDMLEIYWISQFKTWGFKLKNISEGGNTPIHKGAKQTKEHIENARKAKKKYRKPVCQYLVETGELVAEFNSITEAQKLSKLCHIGDCCNGKRKQCGVYFFRYKDNYFPYVERLDVWTGRKHTEDTVEKMKMNHPLRKEICQYTVETDELINEFDSLHEAAEKTSFKRYSISSCCKGTKSYNTVGGYYFRFKDNYFPYLHKK